MSASSLGLIPIFLKDLISIDIGSLVWDMIEEAKSQFLNTRCLYNG